MRDAGASPGHAVTVGRVHWHVRWWPAGQRPGHGSPPRPVALLLHGTGASADSWRALAPLLADLCDVVAPDLPGHARTALPPGATPTLPWVAEALAALLGHLGVEPVLVIGHSAGAAVGAQWCLAGHGRPSGLVAINGALLPLKGPIGRWFSPLAKMLVTNPLVPHAFAWHATWPGVVERLLEGTGSRLDDEGVAIYRRLVRDPAHASGALRMMAAWDLEPLAAALPRLQTPLLLLVGERDRTVPPAHAERVRALVPGASLHRLPGLGHLAHEEDPRAVLAAIDGAGLLPRFSPGRSGIERRV
jgi:magnesium chelatase accessory protein